MKYNPRVAAHRIASLPGFLQQHPYAPEIHSQGLLCVAYMNCKKCLKEMTGMRGVSLTPMAGAQGEFAGVAMIQSISFSTWMIQQRDEILVPDAAHGTNPASAVMCGYKVREIPTNTDGDVDLECIKSSSWSTNGRHYVNQSFNIRCI